MCCVWRGRGEVTLSWPGWLCPVGRPEWRAHSSPHPGQNLAAEASACPGSQSNHQIREYFGIKFMLLVGQQKVKIHAPSEAGKGIKGMDLQHQWGCKTSSDTSGWQWWWHCFQLGPGKRGWGRRINIWFKFALWPQQTKLHTCTGHNFSPYPPQTLRHTALWIKLEHTHTHTLHWLTTCLGMLVSYLRVKFFLSRAILENQNEILKTWSYGIMKLWSYEIMELWNHAILRLQAVSVEQRSEITKAWKHRNGSHPCSAQYW